MTPQEAQARINQINLEQNKLEDKFQELQREKVALGRIVRGDDKHDQAMQAQMDKTWAKLTAAQNGTDAYSQFQENIRLEAAEERRKAALTTPEKTPRQVLKERKEAAQLALIKSLSPK